MHNGAFFIVILNVVMLSVIMLYIVMLSVVAPFKHNSTWPHLSRFKGVTFISV
jgi:hypothetical protein